MNILVIGSGGREHAIVWKLAHNKNIKKIYCAPGNAGISELAEIIPIDVSDINGLKYFASSHNITLTVVGPEVPLSCGISDIFLESGLKIFGPCKDGALLESSKIFAKEFMSRHNIPTADFFIFDEEQKAIDYLRTASYPLVIKADGLAAGKGVIIADNYNEACIAVKNIMIEKIFGNAGDKILIEHFLTGEEASVLAFIDGDTILPMAGAQDHKRILDNDKGANTGGMGAYSPAPVVSKEIEKKINEKIFYPLLNGLKKDRIDYKGVIYAGVMIEKGEPSVLEFNVRFGDPETQVILPRLKSDLLEVMLAVVDNKLKEIQLEWYPSHALCVVIASGGYPEQYEKGKVITGLEKLSSEKDITVFHSGTSLKGDKIITSGGRVLGVTGIGETLKEAYNKAYEGVEKINFENMYFRRDIGHKALKNC
ncbi:phosphoribosylamine--glycine ligase [Candidatus Desantisbacteria bacterium]|nr:phosphoribosylamine--glycine ligase [Candidatus Desantisbacteria bacterium]